MTIIVEDQKLGLKKGDPFEFRSVRGAKGGILPVMAPSRAPWNGDYFLGRHFNTDTLEVFFRTKKGEDMEVLVYTSGKWKRYPLEDYRFTWHSWTCV
jgi:hypothetical protein